MNCEIVRLAVVDIEPVSVALPAQLPIRLELAGPQGPQGDPGPQGSTGTTGPQGPQGAEGATGPAGTTGTPGPQGPQGVPGANGANGTNGVNGTSYGGTSLTSNTIGIGSKTFATQAGLAYTAGPRVRAAAAPLFLPALGGGAGGAGPRAAAPASGPP